MSKLVERLTRLGLMEAAQIVDKFERQTIELHAAHQEIVSLKREIERLTPKPKRKKKT